MGHSFSVAGLFAGIGGIELGLSRSGGATSLLCERWDAAAAVLTNRFPDLPLVEDVRELESLPDVDVVAAGFPCTDLSQAGRTAGIDGDESGLVSEVFRLLGRRRVPVVVLENVRNMLALDGGAAMAFLVGEFERLGYRWAYRLVDSRFTGVPQRRQRVIFVASLDVDPASVLFADEVGPPPKPDREGECFGFYWTEGLRGVGWAVDAIPTLKGGSSLGIPSPPAVWVPAALLGRQVVTPTVVDAERLQGFPTNWTRPAERVSARKGVRMKLTGNAVTVGVFEWVGHRLMHPGLPVDVGVELASRQRWPMAAMGRSGRRFGVDVSMWPLRNRMTRLGDLMDLDSAPPLSARAATGFLDRAHRSSLNFADGFLDAVETHAEFMADRLQVVSA